MESADDLFRDSDDDFRHVAAREDASRDFPLLADAYGRTLRGPDRPRYMCTHAACGIVAWRLACERGTNEFRVMAGIIAWRIITAECGGFDIKSVARMYGRTCASVFSLCVNRSFLNDPFILVAYATTSASSC